MYSSNLQNTPVASITVMLWLLAPQKLHGKKIINSAPLLPKHKFTIHEGKNSLKRGEMTHGRTFYSSLFGRVCYHTVVRYSKDKVLNYGKVALTSFLSAPNVCNTKNHHSANHKCKAYQLLSNAMLINRHHRLPTIVGRGRCHSI